MSTPTRLDAVVDAIPDAVLALGSDGRIYLANPAAERLVGDRLLGRTLLEVLRSPELLSLTRTHERPESAHLELRVGVPLRAVMVHATATPQPEGGCVVVLRDVTELRRLEAVRRDFVANVSHELRTPVSAIQASAEALASGGLDEPEVATQFVHAIVRHSARLAALLEELLTLSRIEAGVYAVRLEPVSLRAVVDAALAVVADRAPPTRARIHNDVPEDVSALGDRRGLEQVLVNFLDNAVKYTPESSPIHVRVTHDGHKVRLEVADQGAGIAPQHRPRLFERFYRVDPGRSRESGGTGLGLAIVKHLAEIMGGAVGHEPNAPHGSVFWVSLPAPPADG